MKVIIYTLTPEGTIPNYVIDGGQFPVENNKDFPQNLDLVGAAMDNAPEEGFSDEAAFLVYIENKGFTFTDSITEEVIPLEIMVNRVWSHFAEATAL